MKKYLLTAILIVFADHVSGQMPADSIKAFIQQEVANKRSKSIIVGIVDAGGRQIFAEGRISDDSPALPDGSTLYEIGSITKVFTSLLLADMSLKQQLSLNDPVSKFLPEGVRVPTYKGKEISLLSLSTHRSGLPRNAFNIDPPEISNPFAHYTREDMYEFISGFELSRDIDARWQYSNIGYALLGDILSIAGHEEFDSLVVQDICRPLGMGSTIFQPSGSLAGNLAQGYTESGQPTGPWDFPLAGGGGLRSNVNDMLTFAEANLGLIQSNLLPAMELTHILRARNDGNDTYTAMGWTLWNVGGKEILFKDGGTGGYRSFLGIDKINKIGVLVLSNSNNSVTDIGWHILDPSIRLEPYHYSWALADTLRSTAKNRGTDEALALYEQLKATKESIFTFNERQLDCIGDELAQAGKVKDAIKIYELNAKEYPDSPSVYENLAEACRSNHDRVSATRYFEKALELDPGNAHFTWMLEKLKR